MNSIRIAICVAAGAFLLAAASASQQEYDCKNAIEVGQLDLSVSGKQDTVYATGRSGEVSVEADAILITHDARSYFAKKCQGDWSGDMFYNFYLLDKTLSYQVDLTGVGCACNAAIYLVSMPGYNESGQHETDYYCDANDVGGIWCPEMDLMESNQHNVAVTPHSCTYTDKDRVYSRCDRGGYGIKAYEQQQDSFGPGANFVVNTKQPFIVSHHFATKDDQLNTITTTFSQADKSFKIVHDNASYLQPFTRALKEGMVMAMSYWGSKASTMSWLDIPPCSNSENCNPGGPVPFSKFTVQ